TAVSLVGIGFAPEIGAWLHAHVVAHVAPRVALASATLVWICTLVVSFHFFNMVLVNAYNWLLRDVVPLELTARFLSWFRIVGSVASAGFLYWVFPHLQSHRKGVFLGVGLFYLVSFLLMCAKVKEGDYPPPPPAGERPGIAGTFALYFRECLSIPLYRYFFLAYISMTIIGMCSAPFALLFTKTTLGINMSDLGHFFAWTVILSSVAYVPLGWLCDRFSPIVVAGLSLLGQLVGALCVYFLVHDKATYLAASLACSIPAVGWGLSSAAMTMKLFPEEKFGQFSSALNVFGCGALILGNVVVGNLMDFVHSNYRMIYLWNAFLLLAAIPPLCLVYREWRRHGGPRAYVAPLPPEAR
ncbi:MAG TPA: MFS transporter, partial [Candidatus Methylacidiphilales bacterium]